MLTVLVAAALISSGPHQNVEIQRPNAVAPVSLPVPEPEPVATSLPAPAPATPFEAPMPPPTASVDPKRAAPAPAHRFSNPTNNLSVRAKAPGNGSGLMTGGSILAAGGMVWTATVVALSQGFGLGPTLSVALALPGISAMGGGTAMIVRGARKHRRFVQWGLDHGLAPPPTGYGLITGGTVLLGASTMFLVQPTGTYRPFLITSVTGMGAAVALLAVGIRRRVRFGRWRRGMDVQPGFATLRQGAMVSVSGRF